MDRLDCAVAGQLQRLVRLRALRKALSFNYDNYCDEIRRRSLSRNILHSCSICCGVCLLYDLSK